MIRNYFKIAWRNLTKRKVFTAINILGLAIGFGSSIIIYLFLNYHFSFEKFHANADRIYRIDTEETRGTVNHIPSVPPGLANTLRDDYDYAEKVAKIVWKENLVLSITKNTSRVKYKENVAFVEDGFFDIFSFPTISGGKPVLSQPNTAVITEKKALKMFGRRNVTGEVFKLDNDKVIEIVGVLKDLPKSTFLKTGVLVAFENLNSFNSFEAGESWYGISGGLNCFALLKPDVKKETLETALLEFPEKYRANDPTTKHIYKLHALNDIHFMKDYGDVDAKFLILFGIIGLFLIGIAAINFINISTALSSYRSREIGIRKVLGSIKQHLFWQFIVETFLISLMAILLGVLMAAIFLPAFNTLFNIELSLKTLLNVQFFGMILLLLGVVTFLSGSYPGILMSRILPVLALKGSFFQKNTKGISTRKVLVVAQFSISIILIVATIVVSKQIDYAVNSDLGFDKDQVAMLSLPKTIDKVQQQSLKGRLKNISGVKEVSMCLSSPGAATSNWYSTVNYDNRPEAEKFQVSLKPGDEDYLKLYDVSFVAGRNFFKKEYSNEMIVNEQFVEKIGVTSEAILGKKLSVNGVTGNIVGVIKDFHNEKFTRGISAMVFTLNTEWYSEISLKISHRDTKSIMADIDREWIQAFPDYIFEYRFLDDRINQQYRTEQRYLFLSKVFSGLAILIGCLGIYGLILFFANQRIKEVGIRKVLGSSVGHILSLFSVDFLKLILIAGAIATPVAWYLTEQWLQGYAYRTKIQWWYFVIAIVLVMLITLVTISYQTIKVAIANPVKSLRTE
ncbi:ABC transporter permease [Flavivirga algicola]|uniref:FtsX-like permease family protein n=1 Tax=Flavivirga algicola TaxID=2729136 RepID=A0ABX1S101_9FLAO|nr:ABC transporter permease [Flavivirga algicola]NMH88913.1 FtsX-like permease family protein [Flavivirga algicola]